MCEQQDYWATELLSHTVDSWHLVHRGIKDNNQNILRFVYDHSWQFKPMFCPLWFTNATSSSLSAGQSKYQRFRILGQSDYRADGASQFLWQTTCLSPSPYHLIISSFVSKNDSQDIFSWISISDFLAGAIKGYNLKSILFLWLHTAISDVVLYILAAYRYFLNSKQWSHESIRWQRCRPLIL